MLTIELKSELFNRDIWWKTICNNLHRLNNQVAITRRNYNGKIWCKSYLVNNRQHRDPREGPAYMTWYPNGQLYHKGYWVNGAKVNQPC